MRYPKPEQGAISFFLLCVMLLDTAWAIEAPRWVPGLDMLAWITFGGLIVGFGLSQIRAPAILLHFFGTATGVGLVAFCVSNLIIQDTWQERIVAVWFRLIAWIQVALGGGISTDNLLFLVLMASIAWMLGYLGAWTVFRSGTAWWAILTTGSVLLINISYARYLVVNLLVYIIAAILLGARTNFANLQRQWKAQGVEHSPALGRHAFQLSILAALTILALSWTIPTIDARDSVSRALGAASGPWHTVESEFNRLFAGLGFPLLTPNSSSTEQALSLKGSVRLGSEPVFEVTTLQGHYWRGTVYETYTGRGWLTGKSTSFEVPAHEDHFSGGGEYMLRQNMTYTVKILSNRGSSIFVPAEPRLLSIPTIAELDLATSGMAALPQSNQVFQSATDTYLEPRGVNSLRATENLNVGTIYSGVSSVSVAGVKNMQTAGSDYPQWVTSRYLALPQTVPAKVEELARKITEGQDNAYDKASAIESYLRQFVYSLDLQAPPQNEDAVAYFLFEAKKGYCDYFASAMAVMCRSVGVPARVVTGYATGEYDFARACYVVTDSQAHTWVEVYFPGLGWIEFEPTSSRTLLSRPTTRAEQELNAPYGLATDVNVTSLQQSLDEMRQDSSNLAATNSPSTWEFAQNVLPIASAILFSAALILGIARFLWQRGFAELPLSQTFYARVHRLSHWLGLKKNETETPYEFARRLSHFTPNARDHIDLITDSYVHSVFGHRLPENEERRKLTCAWKAIRIALLKARLGIDRLGPRHH